MALPQPSGQVSGSLDKGFPDFPGSREQTDPHSEALGEMVLMLWPVGGLPLSLRVWEIQQEIAHLVRMSNTHVYVYSEPAPAFRRDRRRTHHAPTPGDITEAGSHPQSPEPFP